MNVYNNNNSSRGRANYCLVRGEQAIPDSGYVHFFNKNLFKKIRPKLNYKSMLSWGEERFIRIRYKFMEVIYFFTVIFFTARVTTDIHCR